MSWRRSSGGGLVETAIQVAIGSLAVRGGVARTMQVQADQTVTTVGIYLLTIFWPQDLLFLCFIFPLGFVAYLPTTALLGRVAEVSLPARLVWVSPGRAGCCSSCPWCCSTACRDTTRAWGVTRSSVSHVPTRRVPVQPCPTASATAKAKSV